MHGEFRKEENITWRNGIRIVKRDTAGSQHHNTSDLYSQHAAYIKISRREAVVLLGSVRFCVCALRCIHWIFIRASAHHLALSNLLCFACHCIIYIGQQPHAPFNKYPPFKLFFSVHYVLINILVFEILLIVMTMYPAHFVGSACGKHSSYTFFKAFKFRKKEKFKILTLGQSFFIQISEQSPLCVAELQLLWEDTQSNEKLSSTKLYFLPESTPEGRLDYHGQVSLSIFKFIYHH